MPFFSNINEELRVLHARERQIIALVAWAGFFTCFNFIVYFFFYDAIVHAFFPKDLDNDLKSFGFLALVIVGYTSRPLGGLILADIADRLGRKKVMLYSLFSMTFSTLVIGLMPTYDVIGVWAIGLFVLMRLLQGVGIGSELPISWVYMLEQVPRWQTGLASGLMIAVLVVSALVASISATSLSAVLTFEQMYRFGWRIPFIVGALGSLITVFLRYRLTETPLWLNAKQKGELLPKLPVLSVLKKYRYGLTMTFVLSWFSSSVYLIGFLLLPNLAINYFDVSNSEIMIANGLAILFASLGAVMFGYLSDRLNAGKVFGVGCLLLAITSVLFFIIWHIWVIFCCFIM
ncbi:major facilitator transporter [Moraxella macacae 0408225]|uniref:Major facilitator transporter n=1 Tax=Moraxella macacae 0408225 TaxID=1230338 RepID=L2F4Z1_9GAMM|nr:MFS transporter [Moraxella macacae]ELA08067.1 major facilitator transporter [Moraxella macacae 0408225]